MLLAAAALVRVGAGYGVRDARAVILKGCDYAADKEGGDRGTKKRQLKRRKDCGVCLITRHRTACSTQTLDDPL